MDTDKTEMTSQAAQRSGGRGLRAVVVILACVAAASLAYLLRERERASLLSADNQEMSANLAQVRAQLEALTSKVNDLTVQRMSEAQAMHGAITSPGPAQDASAAQQANARRRAPDSRWSKLQTQLQEQQEEIASTREEIQDAREALKSDLESSRYELSGSIARNHDELLALERRGERAYFEFNLTKSKEFQRVGPLSLSLRKTDRKHERYNLEVLVGDNRITKNDLSLYEPAFFYPGGSDRPLELVINNIGKDEVQGYLSAPKYKDAELTSGAAANNTVRSAVSAISPSVQTPQSASGSATSAGPSLQHRPSASSP